LVFAGQRASSKGTAKGSFWLKGTSKNTKVPAKYHHSIYKTHTKGLTKEHTQWCHDQLQKCAKYSCQYGIHALGRPLTKGVYKKQVHGGMDSQHNRTGHHLWPHNLLGLQVVGGCDVSSKSPYTRQCPPVQSALIILVRVWSWFDKALLDGCEL